MTTSEYKLHDVFDLLKGSIKLKTIPTKCHDNKQNKHTRKQTKKSIIIESISYTVFTIKFFFLYSYIINYIFRWSELKNQARFMCDDNERMLNNSNTH